MMTIMSKAGRIEILLALLTPRPILDSSGHPTGKEEAPLLKLSTEQIRDILEVGF